MLNDVYVNVVQCDCMHYVVFAYYVLGTCAHFPCV